MLITRRARSKNCFQFWPHFYSFNNNYLKRKWVRRKCRDFTRPHIWDKESPMRTHLTLALYAEPPISDTLSNILSYLFLNSNQTQTESSREFYGMDFNMVECVKTDQRVAEGMIKLAKICQLCEWQELKFCGNQKSSTLTDSMLESFSNYE